MVELGEARGGTVRAELARALGDPTLEVGYWDSDSRSFTDAEGRTLSIPEEGDRRSMTEIERHGETIAVLLHDPAVLGDPDLIEAVASAAQLAASNARLQVAVKGRLSELKASRRRILEAHDEERRLLDRRLHDGADNGWSDSGTCFPPPSPCLFPRRRPGESAKQKCSFTQSPGATGTGSRTASPRPVRGWLACGAPR